HWTVLASGAVGTAHRLSFARLLRFQPGPVGSTPLAWALLATAALPLLVATGWRFAWAVRLWVTALLSWGAALAVTRGWVGSWAPPTDVLLVPALVALTTAAGIGLAAFEIDLRGHAFGWRQVVSVVAA